MKKDLRKWFCWGIINLAIVALYGVIMRYKIAFNFPFLEQKNLLHAHSHFAFSGWISFMLYTGLTMLLSRHILSKRLKIYKLLLALNLVCSFGMLFSFTIQGYKTISIVFSTLSIILAFIFAVMFIKDQKHLPGSHPSKPWWLAALLLNICSSAGPFSLAYMMAVQNIDHHLYLSSIYFYLHFQYNGWFFFGSMAIAISYLPKHSPSLKTYFILFISTVIPTFFLSVLWMNLPIWLYAVTIIATLIQLITWIILVIKMFKLICATKARPSLSWINSFFYASVLALTLKFLLQAISVAPSISHLVFGFRPVVIAYLHLVLLAVYSLFFIGLLLALKIIVPTSIAKMTSLSFLSGVLLNELLLGLQGFAAFAYTPIPFINEMLLGIAVLLLLSAIGLAIVQFRTQKRSKYLNGVSVI